MMNYLVFNTDPDGLKTTIYGDDAGELRPIAVDNSGMFLLSPLSEITVAANNLDIRNLSSATDSVLITANDLDIRPLSGTTDSVQIYSRNFVEDTISTTVTSGQNYLLTRDISAYGQNSFYIRNTGGSTITVAIQVSPVDDNSLYLDNTTPTAVTASSNFLATVTGSVKFARLRVQAGTTVSVVAYYNARA